MNAAQKAILNSHRERRSGRFGERHRARGSVQLGVGTGQNSGIGLMPEDDVPDWLSDRASGVFVQARPGFDGDEYYVATEAGRDVVVATMDVFSRNHRGLRAVRKGVCLMWEARSDDGDMLRKSMPAHRELSDALPNITLTDLAVRSGVVDMMRSYLQDPGCAPVHRLAFTSA